MSDPKPKPAPKPRIHGVMAEYATPRDVLRAVETVRELGFTRIEAYTPFPIHGIDEAIGHPGSKIPWIVLGGAIAGGTGGLALQWWTSAIDYPIRIAGKPFLSLPAFVPVTFELGVLLSAFAALLGMLALNGLPRPYHPVMRHSTFRRATDDRFFLAIEARDPLFDLEGARRALAAAGGDHVEVLED
jgi:hypothetical protein